MCREFGVPESRRVEKPPKCGDSGVPGSGETARMWGFRGFRVSTNGETARIPVLHSGQGWKPAPSVSVGKLGVFRADQE
jgi:hypothetical protein